MTSKRMWIFGGLVAPVVVAATIAVAADRYPEETYEPYLMDVLNGIDFIPEPEVLSIGPEELIAIARGRDPDKRDPGVRVRAHSALAWYGSATEAELLDAIDEYRARPLSMESFVYLRAATESLARVAGPSADMSETYAAGTLATLLDHGNRDIRTAAARAIGTHGSRADNLVLAEKLLFRLEARLAIEDVPQVHKAIEAALDDIAAALKAARN
jgi:hypothetical protein